MSKEQHEIEAIKVMKQIKYQVCNQIHHQQSNKKFKEISSQKKYTIRTEICKFSYWDIYIRSTREKDTSKRGSINTTTTTSRGITTTRKRTTTTSRKTTTTSKEETRTSARKTYSNQSTRNSV